MSSYLQKRPSSNGAAAGPAAPAVSLEDAAKVPALMEFLTADRWPDGSPRRPGTCLLLADDGRLKVCLSDRDQGLVAFLVVPSLLGAAEAADEALRSSATDWRVSRDSRPRPSGRR